MADIFDRLNILNLSLQGSNTNMFSLSNKVNAFVRKLDLFISQVSKNDLSAFETLNTFWKNNEIQPNSNLITDISEHLQLLKSNILQYFPEDNSEMKWIINPFEDDYIKNIPDGILTKELFIDLTSDSTLKTAFKTKNITNFWLDVKQEYSKNKDKWTNTSIVHTSFTVSNPFCINISVRKYIFSLIVHKK